MTSHDRYSPFNDKYLGEVNRIKLELSSLTATMRPRDVDVCKLRHAGAGRNELASQTGMSQSSISRILNREDSKACLELLGLMRHTVDGPNQEQRLHMLWRIAIDNEQKSPRSAIRAVSEMNKMCGLTEGDNKLTIIIQNGVLQAGPLDE